jgi:hypothetical protein
VEAENERIAAEIEKMQKATTYVYTVSSHLNPIPSRLLSSAPLSSHLLSSHSHLPSPRPLPLDINSPSSDLLLSHLSSPRSPPPLEINLPKAEKIVAAAEAAGVATWDGGNGGEPPGKAELATAKKLLAEAKVQQVPRLT